MTFPDDAHDGIPTIPLFPLSDVPAASAEDRSETKASAPRRVTSATCPSCHNPRDVGLPRQGDHLVWREHTHRWSGAPITCRTSGVAICVPEAAPTGRRADGGPELSCRHGARP